MAILITIVVHEHPPLHVKVIFITNNMNDPHDISDLYILPPKKNCVAPPYILEPPPPPSNIAPPSHDDATSEISM